MGIGISNSGVTRITLKDWKGNVAGTISYTKKTTAKKRKRVQYNFKEISTQLMRAKTSGNASQVATKARGKIALLRQKLRSGEYDDKELESAILHAQQMERVAKKRMKHLKEEEQVVRGEKEQAGESGEEKILEEEAYKNLVAGSGISSDEAAASEERKIEMQENLQKMLQEMQELLQKTAGQGMDDTGNPLQEELLETAPEDMSTEDFEQWKKKHRAEELRDIMEADLKYLKAVFDKLAKEKQQAASGVFLELCGMDVPVEELPMPMPAEGGAVDVQA